MSSRSCQRKRASPPPPLPPALKPASLPRGKHGFREPRRASEGHPGGGLRTRREGRGGRGQPSISSKRRNLRWRRAQKRPENSWLGAEDSPRCRPPAPSRQMAGAREPAASASRGGGSAFPGLLGGAAGLSARRRRGPHLLKPSEKKGGRWGEDSRSFVLRERGCLRRALLPRAGGRRCRERPRRERPRAPRAGAGARTRPRRPGPARSGPARPGPRRPGRRFRPPRSFGNTVQRTGERRPKRRHLRRRREPGKRPEPSPRRASALRGPAGRTVPLRLRSGRPRETPAPSSSAGSPSDSRPGRSRFEEVWQRGGHLGVRSRALHQHTRTQGSAVPTPRPCTPEVAHSARRATRAQADTCHPAGIAFNRGKPAKGK